LIAFPTLIRDSLTTEVRLLYLKSSYYKTVFIESSNLIGCFLEAYSISKLAGTFDKMSSAISFKTSSSLLPPEPPPVEAYKLKATANTLLTVLIAEVISALS
jgi:hypothetical protein